MKYIRTTVWLNPKHAAILKKAAREKNATKSSVVREAIEFYDDRRF